jgi:hypothetical protein
MLAPTKTAPQTDRRYCLGPLCDKRFKTSLQLFLIAPVK